MSSKSTIVLTKDNEHWYEDCSEPIQGPPDWKNAITMEFDKKNIRIEVDDEDSLIITLINPGSELHEIVSKIKQF